MTTPQKFETKIYDSEDGWRIWLVTTRTAWDKVESAFKVQYFVNGRPHLFQSVCRIDGYYDTVDGIQRYLLANQGWIHVWLTTNYTANEHSRYFLATMKELIKGGELKEKVRQHNHKTMHKLEFLPSYKCQDGKHLITLHHDPEVGQLVTLDLYKLDDGIHVDVYAIMENQHGKVLRTQTKTMNPMLRPESVSNEVFRAVNPLMDAVNLNKDDRKDFVAEMREYFENTRFAFWRLLNSLNKHSA